MSTQIEMKFSYGDSSEKPQRKFARDLLFSCDSLALNYGDDLAHRDKLIRHSQNEINLGATSNLSQI